ncbi:MAG: DUF3696 domain-containing protein [Treponema sp.]|nr:DUF3696 domain-containing protein [Treponema sp.]
MITELYLKNYKSFLERKIEFSPLTVLSGMNASGKSSVIQAIRMIQKSCGDGLGDPRLDDHVSPNQLKTKLTKDDYYHLSLTKDSKDYSTEARSIGSDSYEYASDDGQRKKDLACISYISADRLGPKNQLPAGNASEIADVGVNGEYAIAFLDKFRYSKVLESLRLNADSVNLFDNVNAWLSVISKGTLLSYENNQSQNAYFPAYDGISPSETGFGLSFTLPVIIALLYNDEKKSERIVMIENPEAHLHPAAQTSLGLLIALAAASGKQVIIETHSDHIIDGIRIATKQNKIHSSDVKIHFFKRNSFEEETSIETPELYQDGRLSFWPEGFFDQSLKDKALLARKN